MTYFVITSLSSASSTSSNSSYDSLDKTSLRKFRSLTNYDSTLVLFILDPISFKKIVH